MADACSEPVLAEGESRQQDACGRQVCRVPESCPFDCLAITAPNPRAAAAYLDELVHRVGVSGGERTKEVLILAVSDPEGVRIGSGGGTLNAVLEIDQALRATKPTDDKSGPPAAAAVDGGLSAARVLLVHSGGDSQRSPTQCVCGKAWSALNSCGDGTNSTGSSTRCNTPMDLLLDHLSRLFSEDSSSKSLDPGTLVVTACDVMLLIPPEVAATADWSFDAQEVAGGVAGLAIAADAAKYAPNHGVYCLDGGGGGGEGQGRHGITGVSKYLQKPSYDEAENSGAFLPASKSAAGEDTAESSPGNPETSPPEVAIDSGVVVFSGAATAALTTLAYSETFKGCTARGVAEGATALRLELYSDLLLALKTGSAAGKDAEGTPAGGLDAYLAACGPALPVDHALSKARRETWDTLSGFPLGALLLKGATFVHLGTTPELMEMMTLRLPEFIRPYGLTARAASVVGAACSVEADPPAVVVNSRLGGAGVVAGGAVVEHCRFDGDGWEIGAGSLVSGVRSLKADHHLRLRSGMCLQQIDLDLGQRSDAAQENGESPTKSFVVSLFGARDDIKAHYSAGRARVCGATWEAFLGYAGATAEDVWGGVEEADRKLWSARLFPVLKDQAPSAGSAATDLVMWMQDVQEHAASSSSSSSSTTAPSALGEQGGSGGGTANGNGTPPASSSAAAAAAAKWLAAERLSFKEILAKADPRAEFQWRRQLEEGMAARVSPAEEEGGRRCWAWDAVVAVAPTLDHLHEARRLLGGCSLPVSGRGSTAAFCVPPPRPSPTTSSPNPGTEWDGPLILNALLVVAERYSALKRARFGSETSAVAVRGMCILMALAAGVLEGLPGLAANGLEGGAQAGGGVWVLQRDGSMLVIREESIAPLLELCQRDPKYHALTYLGADNGIPAPPTPPGASPTGSATSLDFLAAATAAANTSPPEIVVPLTSVQGRGLNGGPGERGADAAAPVVSAVVKAPEAGVGVPGAAASVAGLEELDAMAADEACTPAGAAQALAQVACRLFDLADALGGGGHRSGPGESGQWQMAMTGLDTLRPLPEGKGWGPPAALPGCVAALKCLRDLWLGLEGDTLSEAHAGSINTAALSHVEPHLVVRCARHYERAAAVVVSAAVRTASAFVELPPPEWALAKYPAEKGEGGNDAGVDPGSAGDPSDAAAVGGDEECLNGATVFRPAAEEKNDKEEQERQRGEDPQDRISRMNPRDQAMARHSQVFANHRKIAADNAKRTQERMLKDRRRFEQQQQQQQPQREQNQRALPVGACVTSRAAARIDLAGGWTDTPPISYETGGAVVNVAVTVGGERPVEARCERIERRSVELVCEGRDGTVTSRTVCSRLEDFADFCIPQAPAALLKAALIGAGIISLAPAAGAAAAPPRTRRDSASDSPAPDDQAPRPSAGSMMAGDDTDNPVTPSLEEQLGRVFGAGGIRITSRSGLPQGSGMGTSSILAGVVLSAACVAAGRAMSSSSLVHAVLRVEQLMTAGGGHQDQVGGLLGGVKICRTTASLPLQVLTETVPLDPAFEDALNERLVLVFTGKQRLARDLLQGVIRGWHDRLPATVNTVKGLVANAESAANACRGTGDLATLGRCLSTYWEQKKRIAPGAEPPAVKALLDKLRPLCHGLSVCGAGGGGFVACITKTPGDKGLEEVTDALSPSSLDSSEETSTISVHRGRLDPVGMEVSIALPAP